MCRAQLIAHPRSSIWTLRSEDSGLAFCFKRESTSCQDGDVGLAALCREASRGLCPSAGWLCALLPGGSNKDTVNSSPGGCRNVMRGERLSLHRGDLPVVGWAGRCPNVGHQRCAGFCCIPRFCFMGGRLTCKQNKDTRETLDIMNNVYAALVLITRPGVRDVAVLALANRCNGELAGVRR